MAAAVQKAEALNARVANLSVPAAGWSAKARLDAQARLNESGLPVRRDEYWRYTQPDSLTAAAAPAWAGDNSDAAVFDGVEPLKLVFVDGQFDADASDALALEGIEISRLAQESTAGDWAEALYGVLEARGQTPVSRPLAALNTLYANDGALIRVTQKVSRPVSLIYVKKSETSDVFLHHVVKLEEGAELTLLESGAGAARLNTVLEVDVAAQARFHHVRLQGTDAERRAVTHIFTRLASESLFKSFTLSAGGALIRNEAIIELLGDDAVAHVAGAALGGARFQHDDTVFITHGAERCESRQVFKKVLKAGATGVFQGKILVKQGAQKTDGYQISQSLLLDDDAQFLAKPELEIYADDVKCSHGSTSGAIDETALFYLRSRGVPEVAAKSLLVLAFVAEALEEIESEQLSELVLGQLELWLSAIEG